MDVILYFQEATLLNWLTDVLEGRGYHNRAKAHQKCMEVPLYRGIMRHYILLTVLLVAFLFSTTGCQLAQSSFARIAGNAGAEFSAAATTLSYVHQGKLTRLYATSNFAGYRSQLDGINQQLPSLQGIPDAHTLQHLLTVYKPAIQAVDSPCLDNACNWHSQENALQQASKAFLEAAGQ